MTPRWMRRRWGRVCLVARSRAPDNLYITIGLLYFQLRRDRWSCLSGEVRRTCIAYWWKMCILGKNPGLFS